MSLHLPERAATVIDHIPDESWEECLACPECHSQLESWAETLRCRSCATSWPIKDGVPHFVKSFRYWGEVPLEQMREVNAVAREASWRSALLESGEPSVQRAT